MRTKTTCSARQLHCVSLAACTASSIEARVWQPRQRGGLRAEKRSVSAGDWPHRCLRTPMNGMNSIARSKSQPRPTQLKTTFNDSPAASGGKAHCMPRRSSRPSHHTIQEDRAEKADARRQRASLPCDDDQNENATRKRTGQKKPALQLPEH